MLPLQISSQPFMLRAVRVQPTAATPSVSASDHRPTDWR